MEKILALYLKLWKCMTWGIETSYGQAVLFDVWSIVVCLLAVKRHSGKGTFLMPARRSTAHMKTGHSI